MFRFVSCSRRNFIINKNSSSSIITKLPLSSSSSSSSFHINQQLYLKTQNIVQCRSITQLTTKQNNQYIKIQKRQISQQQQHTAINQDETIIENQNDDIDIDNSTILSQQQSASSTTHSSASSSIHQGVYSFPSGFDISNIDYWTEEVQRCMTGNAWKDLEILFQNYQQGLTQQLVATPNQTIIAKIAEAVYTAQAPLLRSSIIAKYDTTLDIEFLCPSITSSSLLALCTLYSIEIPISVENLYLSELFRRSEFLAMADYYVDHLRNDLTRFDSTTFFLMCIAIEEYKKEQMHQLRQSHLPQGNFTLDNNTDTTNQQSLTSHFKSSSSSSTSSSVFPITGDSLWSDYQKVESSLLLTSISYTAFVRLLCNVESCHYTALSVFKHLMYRRIVPSSSCVEYAVESSSSVNNPSLFIHFLNYATRCRVTITGRLFNCMMKYYVARRDLQSVVNLFEEMVEHYTIKPTTAHINYLLEASVKRLDITSIINSFELFAEYQVKPDNKSYDQLMRGFELTKWTETLQLYKEEKIVGQGLVLLKQFKPNQIDVDSLQSQALNRYGAVLSPSQYSSLLIYYLNRCLSDSCRPSGRSLRHCCSSFVLSRDLGSLIYYLDQLHKRNDLILNDTVQWAARTIGEQIEDRVQKIHKVQEKYMKQQQRKKDEARKNGTHTPIRTDKEEQERLLDLTVSCQSSIRELHDILALRDTFLPIFFSSSITPTLNCYHSLMNAERALGNFQGLLDLFMRIKYSTHIKPELATYHLMFKAAITDCRSYDNDSLHWSSPSSSDLRSANHHYGEILLWLFHDMIDSGVQPSSKTLPFLIPMYSWLGRQRELYSVASIAELVECSQEMLSAIRKAYQVTPFPQLHELEKRVCAKVRHAQREEKSKQEMTIKQLNKQLQFNGSKFRKAKTVTATTVKQIQ